jgi:hypothetical protein
MLLMVIESTINKPIKHGMYSQFPFQKSKLLSPLPFVKLISREAQQKKNIVPLATILLTVVRMYKGHVQPECNLVIHIGCVQAVV